MSRREIRVPVNDNGDRLVWKVLVGGRTSHVLARPVFPMHQPNYDFDHGAVIRIKAIRRHTGLLPLDDEFARRK